MAFLDLITSSDGAEDHLEWEQRINGLVQHKGGLLSPQSLLLDELYPLARLLCGSDQSENVQGLEKYVELSPRARECLYSLSTGLQ